MFYEIVAFAESGGSAIHIGIARAFLGCAVCVFTKCVKFGYRIHLWIAEEAH